MARVGERAAKKPSYHHGELRATLMKAALASIAASGTEKLSLRALAAEAGVSPTAPYRHFPSKTSLLAALATEGFQELRGQGARAVEETSTPWERLLALGDAYLRYALTYPEKYQLMFGELLDDFSPYEELRRSSDACYGVMLETIAAGVASGDFIDRPTQQLGAVVWAAWHGVASLLIGKGRARRGSHESRPVHSLTWLRNNTREALALMTTVVIEPDTRTWVERTRPAPTTRHRRTRRT